VVRHLRDLLGEPGLFKGRSADLPVHEAPAVRAHTAKIDADADARDLHQFRWWDLWRPAPKTEHPASRAGLLPSAIGLTDEVLEVFAQDEDFPAGMHGRQAAPEPIPDGVGADAATFGRFGDVVDLVALDPP
jgi:hypothetical protein